MFRIGTLFLVLSEFIQGNSGGLQKTQFIKRGQKSFLSYIAIISALKFWRISPSYPPWSFGVYHHHIRHEVLVYITIISAMKFWCFSPSYPPWSFGVYHRHIRPEVLVYIAIIYAPKFWRISPSYPPWSFGVYHHPPWSFKEMIYLDCFEKLYQLSSPG